jgi:hypothetical protein
MSVGEGPATPEDALERAREAARAAGAAAPAGEEAAKLEEAIAPGKPSYEVLQEWARIEVGPDQIYSTRRFGRPLTLVKRGLLRFLRQYTRASEAQQTRFNLAVLARLRDLEERLGERRP